MKKADLHQFPKLFRNIANWQEYTFYKGERSKRSLQFRTRPNAISFEVSQSLYWVFKELFVEDFYNIQELTGSLPADPVILDIGANAGFFDILILSKLKNARIWAYEPLPSNCKLIEATMQRNQALREGLQLFNLAVTGLPVESIKLYTENTGDNSEIASVFSNFDSRNTNALTVPAQSLTSIIEQNGFKKIDLLKLDCEGSEYDILYHTPKEVLHVVKKLVIEVHEIDTEMNNVGALTNYLQTTGYNTRSRQITGTTFYLEAIKGFN
ncbi:MAG: FkbM family methyltransferase [Chitinophagaceae bacterium]